ncbi:cohesin domain-containing protein [Leifsonia aquatica]|uniref:LPXTG-motif cell wall-anchored protein n=1 Tax=Leifsonia aquatica TaxID=144185 RepID=A0A7W4V0I7_LEIAQ|nr:cohesin domain-containing protein [Leifsonia aquatica]MBB2968971.1 LPXTG-motif cell wall-anchored protein [Leifsonia aquatica]
MHQNPRRLVRLLAVATAALAGLGLAVGAAAPAVAAPAVSSVSVSAPATATAGDTFDVTVTLTGATDVYGYESVLAFDPAVVSYVDGSAVVTAGGFDSVRTGAGSVDVVYTRLGTSPALSGDISYTLTFAATAEGSTAFTVRSLSLVDSASAVTASTDAATSPAVAIAPAAVTSPTPTPSTGVAGSGGTGTGGSSTSTAADDLASTGSNALPYVIAALVLLALGAAAVLFTVRRRRAGDAR